MQYTEKTTITYLRTSARITFKVILFVLLFLILLFLLLLTPPAQKILTGKVQNYLSTKFQTKVSIERIAFGLSGNLSLTNVYIEDKSKDTLLSGSSIKAHLNYLKLFSNEVEVKDVELQNITAKIKRTGTDTVFNYQFVMDAFVREKKKDPDTADTAPLKLDVSNLTLDNVRLTFTDVITGSDMFARIGYLTATIDSLDPYTQTYILPTIILRNTVARMKQTKPLMESKPISQDLAEAATPSPTHLNLGTVDLTKVSFKYDNDVSAVYSSFEIGKLKADSRLLDLVNNKIYLDQLQLSDSRSAIRLGKKIGAEIVKEQVKQEVKAEKTAGWDFRVNDLNIENNGITYDDDNQPKQSFGMDYAHLDASALNLGVNGFILATDSIGGTIVNGSFREKSGFVLNELRADFLYSYNQSYLKDLFIKTPGSEIKKSLVLEYASFDALSRNFPQTMMDIDFDKSYLQVKDILTFAPQLRRQKAFSNYNDVWHFDIVARGNLNRINFETLQFDGFSDTKLNASGTLTGLVNPADAGGNFTIYNLHTNQTDLAVFTGQRLSNAQVNLPESFDASGTIAGNAGQFHTNMHVNSSAGAIALNGTFSNITNTAGARYNATVQTSGLQLGRILRQQDQIGTISGNFKFRGSGFTPSSINTSFIANISSVGYNRYQYKNVHLAGTLKKSFFNVKADVNDPNADLNVHLSGDYGSNTSFKINGMVDSIKLHRLHFTPDPFVFHGKIDGNIASLNANYLDGSLLITRALFVTQNGRLPLDSVEVIAGRTDTAQFIKLKSDIAHGQISGQYRLTDLGNIFQNNIRPYFSVTPQKPAAVQPYNINFYADLVYNPVLNSFLPDLKQADNLQIEGNMASAKGLQAVLTSSRIIYQDNDITDLRMNVNTDAAGMHITGNAARLKSGTNIDVYNPRLRATALHNVIDFSAGIDDKASKPKYMISGIFRQPSSGVMQISLKPDSLLLNYQKWSVNPGNSITITKNSVTANNFTLSQGTQQITLQSLDGNGPPLEVRFTNFRIGTLTGFMKADSALVDGITNGTITFTNLVQQPVFTSNLNITDLTFRQDTVGNVALQVSSAGNRYRVNNATITGRGNDVQLSGYFTPQGNDVALDLDLNVRRIEMSTIEGALKDFITSASGSVNGKVTVKGTAKNPDIKGKLNFDKTTLTTVALGGPLTIDNETLDIGNNGFVFNNFTIRDSANNPLTISGSAFTSNFINYRFDLNVNAEKFRVINTTKKNNSIYYGDMYVTTNLRVSGTEQSPKIDGAVTVEDGTNFAFVVPQRSAGVVSREGVVEFVSFTDMGEDSLFRQYDSLNISDFVGYDIATNIEIRKAAKFSIVIDEANGDFVNLQGDAVLSAGIDPSGKINLTGSYVIDQGSYELTYNFLRRKFDIVKGSKIIWMGEPTSASLDVSAKYIANTSPLDLVANYISAPTPAIRNTYLQKLPFEVYLKLGGELMKPDVSFDILLPTDKNYNVSSDIINQVDIRLAQLRQEPSELNKQVFSLLLLNRFVGENPFESSSAGFNVGSFARQSVSKLLTEQLNKIAGNLIAGVDVNFDLLSTDDYTTGEMRSRTDLNVGLSKRLLNDRLTITVGSNFELEGPQRTHQRSNNFAENIAINYQLSRDGKYLLRLYRKNEYFGVVDGYIIETGLNFIITLDYNQFSEILKRRQKVQTGTRETKNPDQQK